MAAAFAAVELCRELGNSEGFVPLVKGETAPGARDRSGMIDFIRRSAVTYWHQSCTAKMGRDSVSVVEGSDRSRPSLKAATDHGSSVAQAR